MVSVKKYVILLQKTGNCAEMRTYPGLEWRKYGIQDGARNGREVENIRTACAEVLRTGQDLKQYMLR